MHGPPSCAVLDQAIGTTFGNAAFQQAISTTFGDAAFQQAIGATFGDTAFQQAISTTFGDAAFQQAISTTFGDAAFQQAIGTAFGNAAFQQAIGTTFGDAAFHQAISATFGNAFFDQAIGAAFGDNRLGGGGEYVGGQDRESKAEDDLAFHEGVLRGAVVGVAPLLRPTTVNKNFIEMMVDIDRGDSSLVCSRSARYRNSGVGWNAAELAGSTP